MTDIYGSIVINIPIQVCIYKHVHAHIHTARLAQMYLHRPCQFQDQIFFLKSSGLPLCLYQRTVTQHLIQYVY